MTSPQSLNFYLTQETVCAYFADKLSNNIVPDPSFPATMNQYNHLIQQGFRRSGSYNYRPHCKNCSRCVACRIPVEQFMPTRSQKRCLRKNKDLSLHITPARLTDEYLQLYQRYLQARHRDGSMAQSNADDFKHFLFCDWSYTLFLELRLNHKLIAVAVTDVVDNGLSAVYSFFEPTLDKRSIGTYCILTQIDYAKSLNLDYLYLGFWIDGHKKMAYKANFKPLELYQNNQWHV